MAQRRRKNQKARALKNLIAVLAVILAVLVVIALTLPGKEPDTLQTGPSGADPTGQTPGTTPSSTPPATTLPPAPVLSGWVEKDGKTYYYQQGAPLTGIQAVEGKTYGFGLDGALLLPGWQDIGTERYYLSSDSTVYTGWLEENGERYYLQSDGTIARGEVKIGEESFFFTSKGCNFYLVNPWNYVPEGYDPPLTKLSDAYGNNQKVASVCYDALIKMMDDCTDAGHKVYILSSYRTHETQTRLFNNQVAKQMAALNCSQEEAERIAATISAIPGTSEHQLGLAVDIIDTRIWDLVEEQEDLPGQQWLMEHCWEYGFVLRYPKDKTDETGIIYEPWHYRYVGKELARELHECGMTLEAYIASLSE